MKVSIEKINRKETDKIDLNFVKKLILLVIVMRFTN